MSRRLTALLEKIRRFALSFPDTREDHPWDHSAYKVNGKIFVAVSTDEAGWGLSVKLEESHAAALKKPFAAPTRYGLGKHGWVTARFTKSQAAPFDLLRRWIEESFTIVAPLKSLKKLR